ncbi:HamA C-terminal domain-containing protein [Roseburia sp. 1XD42-69]|uniref:HamA C-terminal domain-containing protein n=1 Tax=Roseburia sp. 1XD42-69 TaxID=2320088 RepID=UPI000EA2693A|nr:DUF1837 domain-containing protein [Roseburia sp. 1XD42-69]RKJ61374.1 DUF1837 domain-containing protein [Roseburia sp. 1XD42-69]
MEEKDILKRLIKNKALFKNIHVITQRYDILPNNKNHIGAFIEYQDIDELRDDFLEELVDSIVDWIYSAPKFAQLKKKAIAKGKSEAAASQEIGRKARNKFRANHNSDKLLIQGQLGELLLFHFIQHCMHAIPLLRKMSITTSANHERFGADAIHYKIENGKHIMIFGEAKTYTSSYKFNEAFEDALDSIINTYNQRRKELKSYIHEDFLDDELNKVAEDYLNNELNPVEVHLVSIVTYNETSNINITNQIDIQAQIKKVIEEKYKNFDKSKIDIVKNPILRRITYIVFPVWDLKDLAERFQSML